MDVNDKKYNVIKLLGHGKGGYSYLVSLDDKFYVLKQIHHEPCSYYQFGNKLESELRDYEILKNIGIKIPKLIDVDYEKERIIKEYIDGITVDMLDKVDEKYIEKIRIMQAKCQEHDINIDYYPTNFVIKEEELYYIDYECNKYDIKWDFDNWGIKYWLKENTD